MASLKEIRERVSSIRSAGKITKAMQMVASSKLKKAAKAVENCSPYNDMLAGILKDFLAYQQENDSPYIKKRTVRSVTIVAMASNTGFCGSFNSAVNNRMLQEIKKYENQNVSVSVIAVGKKVENFLKNINVESINIGWKYNDNNPEYDDAKYVADYLMEMYRTKKTDKVIIINFHYVNSMIHNLIVSDYLPLDFSKIKPASKSYLHLYILEPRAPELMMMLLPKVLRSKIYSALLDSYSSEQSARTVAMQMASENASKLIDDLTIELNRKRQQQITMEILDLSSGMEEGF
ncbi:MAG: ATP synthase F1 subunit gamma [Bacteroidales bacterium]|nr:ATP synthase F1 subunit gamma [Bacteroidales bacterium]